MVNFAHLNDQLKAANINFFNDELGQQTNPRLEKFTEALNKTQYTPEFKSKLLEGAKKLFENPHYLEKEKEMYRLQDDMQKNDQELRKKHPNGKLNQEEHDNSKKLENLYLKAYEDLPGEIADITKIFGRELTPFLKLLKDSLPTPEELAAQEAAKSNVLTPATKLVETPTVTTEAKPIQQASIPTNVAPVKNALQEPEKTVAVTPAAAPKEEAPAQDDNEYYKLPRKERLSDALKDMLGNKMSAAIVKQAEAFSNDPNYLSLEKEEVRMAALSKNATDTLLKIHNGNSEKFTATEWDKVNGYDHRGIAIKKQIQEYIQSHNHVGYSLDIQDALAHTRPTAEQLGVAPPSIDATLQENGVKPISQDTSTSQSSQQKQQVAKPAGYNR